MTLSMLGAPVRFGDAYKISFQKKGQSVQKTRSADLNKIPDDKAVQTLEEMQSVEDLLSQFLNGIGIPHTFRYVVHGKVDELFLITNTGSRKSYDEFVSIRKAEFQNVQKDKLEQGDLHNVDTMTKMDESIAKSLVEKQVVHQDDEPLLIQYHTTEKNGKTLVEIDNPEKIVKTLRINLKELEKKLQEQEKQLQEQAKQQAGKPSDPQPKP